MSFLGRRLIHWVIQVLSGEGIKEYFIVAHGKENRYQIKVMIGYGESLGVDVQYSPVKFDALSTGSAPEYFMHASATPPLVQPPDILYRDFP